MTDPRLGRRFEPDSRNALFPVRALLPRAAYETPISKTWNILRVLDQGAEGSCVGHGIAHEMLSDPYPDETIEEKDALGIYHFAQMLDDYPGENYSGTSVLAGVKALTSSYDGVDSYRWASSLNDIVATIGYHGPVVVGTNWYDSMYTPAPYTTGTEEASQVTVKGEVAGGHCYLLRGVDIENKQFVLQNSWGLSWGVKGAAFISFDDFDRLLHENGEACVIVHTEWFKKNES